MERLTDKNAVGNYFYPKCFEKCDGLGASSKCDNCEIMTSVCEKLGKYEDLEEQGLLLRLPCHIGDSIYSVIEDGLTIVELKFSLDFYVKRKNDFGKTVFLTKEEAEQKLKEMESDNNGTME